jgi:hypothetical protein
VRRGRNAAWTEEENDRLNAMVAKGVSIARAAVALHRPISSVRSHVRLILRVRQGKVEAARSGR